MCGISGILSLDNKPIKFLDERIKLMTKTLVHRGPDQEGIYISKNKCFALSNNRLSIVSPKEIIDLPFTKNNNEFLSFNGEIYNYIELKKDLEKKGVKFTTDSDQEVLYEYLNKYNFKNLEKINGVWALAHYNQTKNKLLLSRDLMGERHLFYTVSNNELIFSSEVKAILSVLLKKSEFDFDSIISSWKFNSCQPGKTLIKGIYKLKAGYNLICSNNKIETIRFQKLHPEKWFVFFQKLPKEKEVNKKFETLLFNEAKIRIPREVKY